MDEHSFQTGLDLYAAGHFAAALAAFAAVVETDPDNPDALRLYGLSLLRTGQTAAALGYLRLARRLQPQNPLSHLHYGMAVFILGRPARAAALFRRAAMLDPKSAAAWINLSAAILALDRPEAARAAARRAIALNPRSAEAFNALGLAERKARHPAGAVKAFTEATQLAPNVGDFWLSLGSACYAAGQLDAATKAMRQALALDPDNAEAEANLAAFLLLQGEQENALHRLRDVLRRRPDCAPARLNLANALLLDGDIAEAGDLLDGEPPPGRDGSHWRAHRAMALLSRGKTAQAVADLDQISEPYGDVEALVVWRRVIVAEKSGREHEARELAERLARAIESETSGLLEHRIVSHFDLAAFWNRRRRGDLAFEHWRSGHKLLSVIQPFSRKAFGDFVEASRVHFNQDRLRTGVKAVADDHGATFIVGLPRSGTSLIEQILAAHPLVHAGGERSDLMKLMNRLCGSPLSPQGLGKLAALDRAELSEAAGDYLREWRTHAGERPIVVDKMPGNALHLGFIATLFPGARILRCRRDLRDVGLSIYQLRFFGYHPYAHDLGDLGWYMSEHERLMAHWSEASPLPMLDVALKDWVHDFRATLERMLSFLGLPYDSACETFHLQTRRVRTASADQVRQPLNARGIGRWRRFEKHLAPMLAELEQPSRGDDAESS